MSRLLSRSFWIQRLLRARRPSLPKKIGTGTNVNLFCSGHCIRPDGTVFVVGGHIKDGQGAQQACVFDPAAPLNSAWTAKALPNNGRWYPSAITLPDGSVFVISGSFNTGFEIDNIPQIFSRGAWAAASSTAQPFSLYPRLHLAPDGTIFVAGPLARSLTFDFDAPSTGGGTLGAWVVSNPTPTRAAGERQYGSSAEYDSGRIIWTGGGNAAEFDAAGQVIIVGGQPTGVPTKATETINLNRRGAVWKPASDMLNPRRQHNATTLPDGTVLVTGGTQGAGFDNHVAPGPVHAAELWNPATNTWTLMAAESANRCYHSIALLLPTGQVLSAGGGEYGDGMGVNSLINAQIYSPPYLFKGARPVVTNVPQVVKHGQQVDVTVGGTDSISKVTWIRLGSVTHAMNMNQAVVIQRLDPPQKTKVTVKVPTNPGFIAAAGSAGFAPPGHYMLFFVNVQGVPSVAPIVRIDPDALAKKAVPAAPATASVQPMSLMRQAAFTLPELDEKIVAEEKRHVVAVGITPVCPYGLGPCWGGAAEGLQSIDDIDVVRPVPDSANSVAFVYLKNDILPDLDVWRNQFAKTANGSYGLRGIEMTLAGKVSKSHGSAGDKLVMAKTSTRAEVVLAPFKEDSRIEWNIDKEAIKPVTEAEANAYAGLAEALKDGGETVKVTGRLHKNGENDVSVDVRDFKVMDDSTGG